MTPLLKLLALNKGKGQPVKSVVSSDEAAIYLYNVIVFDDYWGGISAETFVQQLNEIDKPVIHLRIDSPGGDAFAGRAIARAIAEHPSEIVAHIDGRAASAATFAVGAANRSFIDPAAMFMIHNAWTIAAGNANEFDKVGNLLRQTDKAIADEYVRKSGQEYDQIKTWMDEETYFFGQQAIDAGFVDALAEDASQESTTQNRIDWDMSAYKDDKPPRNQKAGQDPVPEPTPEPSPIVDLSAHYRKLQFVNLTA